MLSTSFDMPQNHIIMPKTHIYVVQLHSQAVIHKKRIMLGQSKIVYHV